MGKKFLKPLFFLTVGALIAGLAIEGFLVPNKIIDGGILGISIIAAFLVKQHLHSAISLGIFTFCFNLPFLFFALKKFGKFFVLSAIYAVTVMSLTIYAAEQLENFSQATANPILASLFGGFILGIGVGLVLRNSGCLDGTEVMAIALTKKTGFSVGEIIMFFNIFIFIGAGFVYGWDNAMYSILTYFVAYKVIDVVLEGLNESKSIWVISDAYELIGAKIMQELGLSVTYIDAQGGYSGQEKKILYCVASRLEIGKFKAFVKEHDPTAFIAIENVHEVEGKRIKNRKAFI